METMFENANGLITSILGLIESIIKVVSSFAQHPQLTSLLTTLAAVNNSTNATLTCAQIERNNFVTLLNNTANTIEQCFSTYVNSSQTAIQTTLNLFFNLGDIIANVTDSTAECIQNDSSLLEIPVCVLTQVTNLGNTISQIVNEITVEAQVAVGVVGSVISNTSTCIGDIVREFAINVFIVITTFITCLSEI